MGTSYCPRCERVIHVSADDTRFCPVCASPVETPPDPYQPDIAAERIAKNEAIFREANERIRDAANGDMVAFVCECGQQTCNAPVRLSLDDHRRVREKGAWFFTLPGHDFPGLEKIVELHPAYQIVEKLGPGRTIAEGMRSATDR